jgi:hypothetical protein
MAKKQWTGLAMIETISGTAQDDSDFRGFVTIRAVAEDGSFMSGQLSVEETKQMALRFLETATAADQDAVVFRVMTNKLDLEPAAVAAFVMDMRAEREKDD